MTDRTILFAEALSETTQTGTTWLEKVRLTFTPDANSDYLLIWSFVLGGDNTTNRVQARAWRLGGTSGNAELGWHDMIARATSDRRPVCGFKRYQSGGAPVEQALVLEFRSPAAGGTARIRSVQVMALKMVASDEYSESDGTTTSTSTSFVTKLTHTLASAGDKLVLAYIEHAVNANGVDIRSKLIRPDTTEITYNGRFGNASEDWSWFGVYRDTAAAVGEIVRWQTASPSTSHTSTIKRARIFVMDLGDVPGFAFDQDSTARSYTGIVNWSEEGVVDPPPVAGVNQLLIAQSALKVAAETDHPHWRVIDEADAAFVYGESHIRPTVATAENFPMSMLRCLATAPDFPVSMEYKASGGTVGMDFSFLGWLQLVAPVSGLPVPSLNVAGVAVPKPWFLNVGGAAVEVGVQVNVGGVAQDP